MSLVKEFISESEFLTYFDRIDINIVFVSLSEKTPFPYEVIHHLTISEQPFIILSEEKAFAYEAFRHGAAGFLLLPICPTELSIILKRMNELLIHKGGNILNPELIKDIHSQLAKEELLGIPTMDGFDYVRMCDIIRCEGLQRCTKIVLINKKPIISSYNLGEFSKLLNAYGFFSPHRSHLINLRYVRKYRKEGSITMVSGCNVPVSRRRKAEFIELLLHI